MAVVTHFALVSCQLKSKLTILTIVHGDVVREKKHVEEVIRLLTEIDANLKENNSILKQDHSVILAMAEDIRKIKINTA